MRVKELKGWHKEANREKETEGRSWELVVRIVHMIFRDRTVPEDIVWATMVLLPKGKG